MKRFQPKDPASTSLLRIARISREMTQRDLAGEAGMTQVAISHIESGRTEPKWSTRELLADVLGYELTDVFPPSGKKSTSPELRKLLTEDLKKRKRAK